MNYYKATRLDGTDFHTGTIDYAAALASGEILCHPATLVPNQPETYFSVAIVPTDCTRMKWPCRLFRVQPIGRTRTAGGLPNKRACSALRVVEELPAHLVLGPQGEEVAALIERCRALTADEVEALGVALNAAWAAVWNAALDAARNAAVAAVLDAVRNAVLDAAWAAARNAARNAALALLVRDRLSEQQFRRLYGPWAQVIDREA